MNTRPSMEDIISLCKRRGFIYPGSELYGGLAGTWDYGPLGVALKRNLQNIWWKMFVTDRDDMYGIDAALIMNPGVWKASGHVAGFSDPLVECKKCKKRFRSDHLESSTCPECNTGDAFGDVRQFNMMFKTTVGALEDEDAVAYLRPETAQGMFVNFKNVIDSFHPKLPFGMAQIGKAFRNEIAPRDFVFRSREFEQMEIEYFVKEDEWEKYFKQWMDAMYDWMQTIGIHKEHVHELEVSPEDRAHYSKRTVDFEFDFAFGKKELYGLAYRTDFDLKNHAEATGQPLYIEGDNGEKITPHCIEPTFGVDRTILAVLTDAYTEVGEGEDKHVVLKLKPSLAPYKACVSPLLKNKPKLVAKAREVFTMLKKTFGTIAWDDNGNIGKRYRRHDEIGTPWCIVVDFDTLGENASLADTVTVRDRDTGNQERIAIGELGSFIQSRLS